jgi:hypothetical protein
MKQHCDFHMHSSFSDGRGSPEELVEAALKDDPETRYLALTDHNGFYGCEQFLRACTANGIEGFAAGELACRHDSLFAHAFHFIPVLGNQWTPEVATRTEAFIPIINAHHEYNIEETFRLLSALSKLGHHINFDEVREAQGIPYAEDRKPIWRNKHTQDAFEALLAVMEKKNIPVGAREAHEQSGIEPAHYAPLENFYDLLRELACPWILAHPMRPTGSITVDELRPVLKEWVEADIGLMGMECYYEGIFYPEWKALADEFGLLGSAGSDTHCRYTSERMHVPAPGIEEADIEALVEIFRKAGKE